MRTKKIDPAWSWKGTGLLLAGAWTMVAALAAFAYWPGLGGPWLFDDFDSLSSLGKLGGVRNWETFNAFVFGGTAGPTGRPLALLTFLIDGQNWPTDAWPFKRTNVVIHIINGALLSVLVSQILSVLNFDRQKSRQIALITAACWTLHPFLVSTTLYVVQRMAQLSTLFMIAGLIGYMHGRVRIEHTPTRAYLMMSGSLVACTLLAILAKENGVLLPTLALVLEMTVLASAGVARLNRIWLAVFTILPSIVVLGDLVNRAIDERFFEVVPPRDFSIYERLLTQSRVLVDYLQNWFVPKLYTTGVFQDHFIKSTGLLSPPSTLAASVFHLALISFSLVVRRRWPLAALAILFFYVGHLLESTVVNLELYFEHRNYLPAALLFVPFVVYLREKLDTRAFFVVGTLVIVMLGGFTRYSATVWQDFELMAATSARKAPSSARAQANHSANLFNAGQIDESFAVLDRALGDVNSSKPLLIVQRLILSCHTQRLERREFERYADVLSGLAYDARMLNMYQELADAILEDNCPSVPGEALLSMFERMLRTPPNNDPETILYSQVQYFIGYTQAYLDQPAAAVDAFQASLDSHPDASSAMAMAAVLASNQHRVEALYLSEIALRLLASGDGDVRGTNINEKDVLQFQATVRAADLTEPQGGDKRDPAQ